MQNRVTTGKELRTLIHEIGHIYKAPDHYNETGKCSITELLKLDENQREKRFGTADIGEYSDNCIFGLNNGSVNVYDHDSVMCDACYSIVNFNAGRYDE